MGKGMIGVEYKRKRDLRRRNHVARDLEDDKYHQRIKKGKQKPPPSIDEFDED